MPNWCDNRLTIRGAPDDVRQLIELVAGDSPFDFDRVIEMPKPILGGEAYDAPGVLGAFSDWRQWSLEHWGTIWNAFYVSCHDEARTGHVRYRFFTAYNPPFPVLHELARRFPGVEMDLSYEIELVGTGTAAWRAGELVESSDEPS